jgi:hypothetical protein
VLWWQSVHRQINRRKDRVTVASSKAHRSWTSSHR